MFINRKMILVASGSLILSGLGVGSLVFHYNWRARKQDSSCKEITQKATAALAESERQQAKIKTDFDNLQKERENLLIQIKGLLSDRARVKEVEAQIGQNKEQLEKFGNENKGLLEQALELKNNVGALQLQLEKLSEEKNVLSDELAQERDTSILKRTEKEKDVLTKENAGLLKELKASKAKAHEMQAKFAETDRQLQKLSAENNDLSVKFETLTKAHTDALQKNKKLEQAIVDQPKKFAEIARQNASLIKRAANTHYNAGVFYMREKEYSRAANEFQKALELNPDDAYAHFNLGYIYAEHLVNRDRAIAEFRDYLRLAKKDDKDVDWVKNYLLTWESWEGKKPVP